MVVTPAWRRRAGAVVGILLTAALLVSSGGTPERVLDAATEVRPVTSYRYAALGDSYTAGPGLVRQRPGPSGCRRSERNYPHRVAARLGLRLRDASCSGARRRDLAESQLEVVNRRTDLVTLGLGANEFGTFFQLFDGCVEVTARRPGARRPCRDQHTVRRDGRTIDLKRRDARRVQRRTARSIRQIDRRAPDARILVVGYPRMVPRDRGCPGLPLTAADTRWARGIWARVNVSLRRASRAADVEFVDPHPTSNRHHICSRDPWVNGSRPRRGEGSRFHPTPAGMAGMTRLVVRQLRSGG